MQNFEAHVEPPDVPVVPAAMLSAVKVIEQMVKASGLAASRKTHHRLRFEQLVRRWRQLLLAQCGSSALTVL